MSKGPNAFRTISEAADEIGVPQHVLRFWETKFSFIRPMKRAGGRRFYRPQDILVLKGVKSLLYGQGYKIEGVQKLHRDQGLRRVVAAADPDAAQALNGHDLDESFEPEHAHDHEPEPEAADLDLNKLERLRRALHEMEVAKAKLDALLES